jgi:HEAT repeat protein
VLDPTRVLRGIITRESFYRGRPTSYWREAILDDRPETVLATRNAFGDGRLDELPVLIELLRSPAGSKWETAKVHWCAAELLGIHGHLLCDPKWIAGDPPLMIARRESVSLALVAALKDEDPLVRKVAIDSLGRVRGAPIAAVPALIGLLQTSDRLYVVQTLGAFRGEAKDAVVALEPLLTDKDLEVRWNTAWTLGKIGPAAKNAVPALIRALKDPEGKVREHAAEAVGDIGPEAKEAVPALVEALKDPDAGVRRDAVRALGDVGQVAKPALPAITALLKDATPRVREATEVAIKRINAPDAPAGSSVKKEDDD